jgi:AcrR family transcriptional regulator
MHGKTAKTRELRNSGARVNGNAANVEGSSTTDRAAQARYRIVDAVITVLAEVGISGLTHRRVAKAAGISPSATTYHYAAKSDMLADASQRLLSGYLRNFKVIFRELREARRPKSGVDDLGALLVVNAAGRHRRSALAWCEIILDAARSPAGHELARSWFVELAECWLEVAEATGGTDSGAVQVAIDTVIGLQFMVLSLGLTEDQVRVVYQGGDPKKAWELRPVPRPVARRAQSKWGRKAQSTRATILQSAIDLLIKHGAGAVSYRAIAERSGIALTTPAYYFGSISDLLRAAEAELFSASKDRYREVLAAATRSASSIGQLADLTAAIFIREATEFCLASVAHYAIWLEAGRSAALRPEVADAIYDQIVAWQRRLKGVGMGSPQDGLRLQALFVGQLIRAISSGSSIEVLADARQEFCLALTAAPG